MQSRFSLLFFSAIILQIIIIFAVLGFYYIDSFSGQDILLKLAVPKDPMSLFQGHYLTLRYEISDLNMDSLSFGNISGGDFKTGDEIFVGLSKEGNYWKAVSVSKERPKDVLSIKGKVGFVSFRSGSFGTESHYAVNNNEIERMMVSYGIEKYFIDERNWQKTEDTLRQATSQGVAYVLVNIGRFSGKGKVKKIFIDGQELRAGDASQKFSSGDSYDSLKKAKDSRIIAGLAQLRTVMAMMYGNDGNYNRFSCQDAEQAQICLDISKAGGQAIIARNPWGGQLNSREACAYSKVNNPASPWYCVDSTGRNGFVSVDPGGTGYCLEGKGAVCPRLVGEVGDVPALKPSPQASTTNDLSAGGKGASSDQSSAERFIKVIFPNGKETFCMGESIVIQWQSKGVDGASVSVVAGSKDSSQKYDATRYYNLNDYVAIKQTTNVAMPNLSHLAWTVGDYITTNTDIKMREGSNYSVVVSSNDGRSKVSDISDKTIEIKNCQK